uniref:Uncharacterized protein n=1 Tax=Cacopsylla melanoneura TaxID=428564 RepID=A0A8D8TYA0_9HEMI
MAVHDPPPVTRSVAKACESDSHHPSANPIQSAGYDVDSTQHIHQQRPPVSCLWSSLRNQSWADESQERCSMPECFTTFFKEETRLRQHRIIDGVLQIMYVCITIKDFNCVIIITNCRPPSNSEYLIMHLTGLETRTPG